MQPVASPPPTSKINWWWRVLLTDQLNWKQHAIPSRIDLSSVFIFFSFRLFFHFSVALLLEISNFLDTCKCLPNIFFVSFCFFLVDSLTVSSPSRGRTPSFPCWLIDGMPDSVAWSTVYFSHSHSLTCPVYHRFHNRPTFFVILTPLQVLFQLCETRRNGVEQLRRVGSLFRKDTSCRMSWLFGRSKFSKGGTEEPNSHTGQQLWSREHGASTVWWSSGWSSDTNTTREFLSVSTILITQKLHSVRYLNNQIYNVFYPTQIVETVWEPPNRLNKKPSMHTE